MTVSLRPDLNVLVGQNNGGKSNIVGAIRLLALPMSGRQVGFTPGFSPRPSHIIRTEGLSTLQGDVRKFGMAKEGLIARQFR